MKTTVYKCDNCMKVLSDEEGFAVNHLTISFGRCTGHAEKADDHWRVRNSFSGVMQFCNSDCLKKYFDDFVVAPEK